MKNTISEDKFNYLAFSEQAKLENYENYLDMTAEYRVLTEEQTTRLLALGPVISEKELAKLPNSQSWMEISDIIYDYCRSTHVYTTFLDVISNHFPEFQPSAVAVIYLRLKGYSIPVLPIESV